MMNREKVIELAREAGFFERLFPFYGWGAQDNALEHFVSLIERELRGDAEPVAYEIVQELWAADDPDINDWIKQNGRPLYPHPAPAVLRQLVEAAERAEDSLLACKQTLKNLDFSMSESSKKVFETVCVELNSALAAAKEAGL